jgi:hypothetical protein
VQLRRTRENRNDNKSSALAFKIPEKNRVGKNKWWGNVGRNLMEESFGVAEIPWELMKYWKTFGNFDG